MDGHLPVTDRFTGIPNGEPIELGRVGPVMRVTASIPSLSDGRSGCASAHDDTRSWTIDLDGIEHFLLVGGADDEPLTEIPLAGAGGTLDIVADTDIVEITWSGGSGVAATQIPASPTAELSMTVKGQLAVDQVVIHRESG